MKITKAPHSTGKVKNLEPVLRSTRTSAQIRSYQLPVKASAVNRVYQFKELTCYRSYQFKPDPQSLEFDFNSPHSVPVNTLRGVPDLRFDLLLPLICSYQFDFAFAQCRERTIPAITYLASPRLSPSITAPRLSHSQSLALASPPLSPPLILPHLL